jgi:TolB protein
MKLIFFLFIIVSFSLTIFPQSDTLSFKGEKRLKNIKMLTHYGENAEAYLSFDEKNLSFNQPAMNLNAIRYSQ